ncbi:MAG: DUF4173 domain-containing protein [Anaerolineae bacterium]
MDRRLLSAWQVGAGLLLGIFGMLVFYGRLIGVSFPLFIVALVGMVLAFNLHQPNMRRNLWLVGVLLFFAAMVAVRGEWMLTSLNILAVFTLGALALFYIRTGKHVDAVPLMQHVSGVIQSGFTIPMIAAPRFLDARRWLAEHLPQNRTALMSTGRGVLFALPVLLVFGVLLGSADAVFGQYINNLFSSFNFVNVDDLIGRTFSVAAIGWLAVGVLAYSLPIAVPAPTPKASAEVEEEQPAVEAAPKRKPGFKVSLIEGGIVLGSVNLMFAAFVVIQFAYFFGGRVAANLSYSEYARRGFFELVAVSVLTLGLVLLMDHVTVRQSTNENRVFRGLALLMVLLTGVILVSAWRRMSLYEDAYGYTHLRIYTRVFMGWLAVLFGFFLLSLFRMRLHIFTLGILLSSIGFIATLNILNIDYYIAEQNIQRYYAGYDFDVRFLAYLSEDALPPIIDLYHNTDDPELRADLEQILARQYNELRLARTYWGGDTFLSANFMRDRAWVTLSDMSLPDYDPSYSLWGYSAYDYSRGD